MAQRYGLTIPMDGCLSATGQPSSSLLDQRRLIESLPDLGYSDVWSGEVDGVDAFTPLLLASQWAPALRIGPAIIPVYTRGPALIAQTAAAMAAAAPGRFVLGLGASSNVIVENWNGLAFDRPYERVRDVLRFVKAALGGERVTEAYETFSVEGFRLSCVPDHHVPVFIAALRPRMLRLAASEADGAITNWLSPDDVTMVASDVRAAGKELVARVFVLPTEDPDVARTTARRMIAQYLNVPVYAAFHRWLGRGEVLSQMWDAWACGDRKKALAAIPDRVVDDLFAWGPPARVKEMVHRYVENGVTCPVLMVLPVGDPLPYLRAIPQQ
jgi:probable F420-dependent oxidoreductase